MGAVSDGLHLDMYLQLKRSPAQELAAQQFVESLTDRTSPNFHKWITAAEYGQRFGRRAEDIATISAWLNRMVLRSMAFPAQYGDRFLRNGRPGTEALHTEIHNLVVAGKQYFANMNDPQIPSALLPAVTGVASLNNFMPSPMYTARSQYTIGSNTKRSSRVT